ncbi:hypothetical protein P8452_38466 [Trifolium repens]|nr:hypothetical protein P8452_38466 [Trifolium repens]
MMEKKQGKEATKYCEKKAKKNSNGKETIGPKAPKTKKELKTKKAPKTKKGKNGPTEIGQRSQAPLAIVMLLTIIHNLCIFIGHHPFRHGKGLRRIEPMSGHEVDRKITCLEGQITRNGSRQPVLLAENGRLKNVGIIAKRFAELAMAYKGEVKAIVTTVLVPTAMFGSVKSSAITSQFIKDSKIKLGSKFLHRQFWSDCSGRLYDDDLLDIDKLHAEVDCRREETMTKIDDQGQCGSCWAHAATAAVESAISIYGGELQKLSSQELIECDSGNDGCNGGRANKTFEYICKNGLHKYDDYPSKKGSKTYIVGHKEIPFKNDGDDENRLRHAVSRQPVTVSIAVGDEFSSYKGRHGVFRTETEFWVPHAVLVIGYGVLDGTKY